MTTAFAVSETAQLLGTIVFPMVTLVHSAGGVAGGGGGSISGGVGGGPLTNAASSLRASDGRVFLEKSVPGALASCLSIGGYGG